MEDGYSGVTTTAIQERAGISRGRLLHHFPSRERLLVAAVDHLAQERVRVTLDRMDWDDHAGDDHGRRIDRNVRMMWLTFHEPHFAAAMELWVAARTNPEIAHSLQPGERLLGDVIGIAVDRMWGRDFVDHPHFSLVKDLLLTSMRGAAMAYFFRPNDPNTDPRLPQWIDVAATLLDQSTLPSAKAS